jgi:predicted nucleic acid-binding Zn finger protein
MLSEAQYEILTAVLPLRTRSYNERESTSVIADIVLQSVWHVLHDQPKLIEHAMEVIDIDGKLRNPIQQYTDSSGRCFFLVRGSLGQDYLCLEQYCSCQNFAQLSFGHERKVMCKHLLALRISSTLGLTNVNNCTNESFLSTFLAASTSLP